MQFYNKFLFDSLRRDINYKINVTDGSVSWRFTLKAVGKNPVPISQTKPFYIGTKEAPSDIIIRPFVYKF